MSDTETYELTDDFENVSIGNSAPPSVAEPVPETPQRQVFDYNQWALAGNDRYTPVGSTTSRVPAGIYEPFAEANTWGFQKMDINSDEIYELPDMATNGVVAEAEKFWANEHKYRQHNLLYKRGVILYGPPGSGKTVTLKLLMKKLVQRNGIVLVVTSVGLTVACLKAIRRVEPTRNLIVVFEDIDEIINNQGESSVLSLLDGEHNIDRVFNTATTNYPERLGARIINRPSRFDTRVEVGMPGPAARNAYLTKATNGQLSDQDLFQWTLDTENLSIAHLRELVAAVYCLDQPYPEVIYRLQNMSKWIKPKADFKEEAAVGFASSRAKPKTTVFKMPGLSSYKLIE